MPILLPIISSVESSLGSWCLSSPSWPRSPPLDLVDLDSDAELGLVTNVFSSVSTPTILYVGSGYAPRGHKGKKVGSRTLTVNFSCNSEEKLKKRHLNFYQSLSIINW